MHSSRMRTTRSSSHQLGGSASVHAGIHTPLGVGLEAPLVVGLETSPGCGPGDPLGVGLETPPNGYGPGEPPCQTPQAPLPGCGPGNVQDMLGYTPPRPARHAGIYPPGDLQGMLGCHPSTLWTDTCKNITFANFVCWR